MLEKNIPQLDKNEISWRKLYFLRNIFRTMLEIYSAIHSLRMNPVFKKAILQQPKPLKDAFERLSKDIKNAHPLIKKYRNSIGGHVKEQSILDTLRRVSPERSGFLELDVTNRRYHLNFTSELCMAILYDEYPDDVQLEKAEELISELKKTMPFIAIDAIITTYIQARGLL